MSDVSTALANIINAWCNAQSEPRVFGLKAPINGSVQMNGEGKFRQVRFVGNEEFLFVGARVSSANGNLIFRFAPAAAADYLFLEVGERDIGKFFETFMPDFLLPVVFDAAGTTFNRFKGKIGRQMEREKEAERVKAQVNAYSGNVNWGLF